MFTDLGQLTVSHLQMRAAHTLHDDNIYAFYLKSNGHIIAEHKTALTDPQKSTLISALQGLPKTLTDRELEKQEFSGSPFHNITADQAEQWIENNVTDLASAKAALKRMAKVLIYLIKRTDLEAKNHGSKRAD